MKNLPKDKDAGIRKLPSSVQENMGYDPLSQQRSMTAGGSRPMHQASTVQIDPMTGLPLQANAPNMGNFGGAMDMSNVPMYDQSMSPGAIAQSRDYMKKGTVYVEKARMQKMKEDNSFRLGQMISNKGDTTSFELRPTGTGENKKNIISNEEYKRRMSGPSSIDKKL